MSDDDTTTEEEYEHDPTECDDESPCGACCNLGCCNATTDFFPTPAAYGADWILEPCPFCHHCANPTAVAQFGQIDEGAANTATNRHVWDDPKTGAPVYAILRETGRTKMIGLQGETTLTLEALSGDQWEIVINNDNCRTPLKTIAAAAHEELRNDDWDLLHAFPAHDDGRYTRIGRNLSATGLVQRALGIDRDAEPDIAIGGTWLLRWRDAVAPEPRLQDDDGSAAAKRPHVGGAFSDLCL